MWLSHPQDTRSGSLQKASIAANILAPSSTRTRTRSPHVTGSAAAPYSTARGSVRNHAFPPFDCGDVKTDGRRPVGLRNYPKTESVTCPARPARYARAPAPLDAPEQPRDPAPSVHKSHVWCLPLCTLSARTYYEVYINTSLVAPSLKKHTYLVGRGRIMSLLPLP